MSILARSAVTVAAMAGLVVGAAADSKQAWVADASRGERLSETFCASCHVVNPGKNGSVVAGVPSFRALTELSNQRISDILIAPHPPMPDMQLTRNEIADILAYIEDIRRKAAGQPPVDGTRREKPKYPSPS